MSGQCSQQMRIALAVLATVAAALATSAAAQQGESHPVPLRVEVTAPAGLASGGPPRGLLELVPLGDQGKSLELPLDGDGSYTAAVAPESMWRVLVSAEGYWGAEEVAVAGAGTAVVALFPAGELRGKLSQPAKGTRPGELHLIFEPSPASPRTDRARPAGRIECPVDEQGWRCTLPAGVFDLRFHAPGFASALVWDATVKAGTVSPGAPVSLVPGAALLGRVEVDGVARMEEVEVDLRPAVAATRDPDSDGRLGHLYRTTGADERGYFQFHDLAAGAYRVEARYAGLAPAVREPVEVMEGREADLVTPLVLAPPSELVLLVDPPAPPRGLREWKVELHALDGSNQTRITHTDPTGAAELELAPGWYRLTVGLGRTTWVDEEIEVPTGTTVRNLEIPIVAVEGTVRVGERPVRARLDFGGQVPRTEEVTISTDHEGLFSSYLPAEGEWPLAVLFAPGGGEQRLEPVEVVRRPGEDFARLDIELHETLLVGKVVDSAGVPVDGAMVLVGQEGSRAGRSEARSDESGRFRLWSLPPGEWMVEAFSMARSGRTDVDLREGGPVEVEIRLSDERMLAGRVVSDWGPVAGAHLYAVPEVPRTTPVPAWRTDPLGGFEVWVPADATGIHLLVLATGRAARLLWVPLPPVGQETPEVEVALTASAGTLRLELPPPGGGRVELRRGAARVWVHLLRDWASLNGMREAWAGVWTVEAVEPGPWALCRGEECDRGLLLAGGELELSLVASEERAAAR